MTSRARPFPSATSVLERALLGEFDAWRSTFDNPYDDLRDRDADRNWDHDRRLAELKADGVVAEVVFPNTVPPFFPKPSLVAQPPGATAGDWHLISIFLSPMDVHVNRMPVTGRVVRVKYHPGRFLPAYKVEAGDLNEYTEVTLAPYEFDRTSQASVGCAPELGDLDEYLTLHVVHADSGDSKYDVYAGVSIDPEGQAAVDSVRTVLPAGVPAAAAPIAVRRGPPASPSPPRRSMRPSTPARTRPIRIRSSSTWAALAASRRSSRASSSSSRCR